MYADTISLDYQLKEMTSHGTNDFPIQFYVDELYRFKNRRIPLHWHTELEFFVVMGGITRIQIGNQQVFLNPGEGIFINSNVLHLFEQMKKKAYCQCPNIVFSSELIAPMKSVLYQKYLKPIMKNQSIPFFILRPTCSWQNEILDKLFHIFTLLHKYGSKGTCEVLSIIGNKYAESTSSCYEMKVQSELNHIWQIVYSHLDEIPIVLQEKKELQSQIRLQKMLTYIQENYMDTITLQDISSSADISKSEASRCFHTYMERSPIEYLLQYRIEIAKNLLDTVPLSIHEICLECGFHSTSYFSKVFREKTGMTPKKYRNSLI